MTPTTGTDDHPEVTEISALAEGLLAPERSAEVRGHLDGCPLCDDVRASLEEIRSLLGTLPGPVRMPSDIAGRIDAALAAEALLDATTPADAVSRETPGDTTAPVSRETSRAPEDGEPDGESRPDRSTGERPADRPAGRPRAATGPGRKTSRREGRRSRRWPTVLLTTACAAAVIGVGTFFIQQSPGSSGEGPQQAARDTTASAKKNAESAALSAADLEGRVKELLAGQPKGSRPDEPSRGVASQTSPAAPLRAGEDQVPSCVQAGTGRQETPLATQQDTYNGTPAYIVVLPHPADSSRVDAFVIDAACTKASPAAAGTVLETRTFARG